MKVSIYSKGLGQYVSHWAAVFDFGDTLRVVELCANGGEEGMRWCYNDWCVTETSSLTEWINAYGCSNKVMPSTDAGSCSPQLLLQRVQSHPMNRQLYEMLFNNCQKWVIRLLETFGIPEDKLPLAVGDVADFGARHGACMLGERAVAAAVAPQVVARAGTAAVARVPWWNIGAQLGTRAAARGAAGAVGPAGWVAFAGELVGGGAACGVANACGASEQTKEKATETGRFGGAVGGGAIGGACVAGPIGAGVGAGVGLACWGVGKIMDKAVGSYTAQK